MLENKIPIFKISSRFILCAFIETPTINNTINVLNASERIFLRFDREETAEIKTPSPKEIIIGIIGRNKRESRNIIFPEIPVSAFILKIITEGSTTITLIEKFVR